MPVFKVETPIRQVAVTPRVPKDPMFEVADQAPPEAKLYAETQAEHFIVTRPWIEFLEKLGKFYGYGAKTARWNINSKLTIKDDLTPRYICKKPGGAFGGLAAISVNPPTGSNARLEIEKSTDRGLTWNSILKDPYYVELQDGDATLHEWYGIFPDKEPGRIKRHDILRMNCIQPGSTFGGSEIFVILEWF